MNVIVDKCSNKFVIHCENDTEHMFLDTLLKMISDASPQDVHIASNELNKNGMICKNTHHDKEAGMIFKCTLPIHVNRRHVTFISWDD